MYKEVKVFHKGVTSTDACRLLSRKLTTLGLPPVSLLSYDYLPISSANDEDTFLYLYLGGWDGDPENELKQRLAQVLDKEFEIHEGLLSSLGEEEDEGYAVIPKGVTLFEKALYYETESSAYVVIPDSSLDLENAFKAGLEKKLNHCFSKVQRLYEKKYFFEQWQELEKLKLQFPKHEFTQKRVEKLSCIRARCLSPSINNPETLFELVDSFIGDALPFHENLAEAAIEKLKVVGATLSLAESCTGGALAKELTEVAGASEVFKGSLVCYSNALKEKILGVPATLLKEKGAVSAEVSQAMCRGLESDYKIAITGTAGPTGGTAAKPVGTVWVTLEGPEGLFKTWNVEAQGTRGEIISQTVQSALVNLITLLNC